MPEVRKVETEDRGVYEHVPPGPCAWYCPDCRYLHVHGDECPKTQRARGDR